MPKAIFSAFSLFESVSDISCPSSQYGNVIYLLISPYLYQILLLRPNVENKPKFAAAQ